MGVSIWKERGWETTQPYTGECWCTSKAFTLPNKEVETTMDIITGMMIWINWSISPMLEILCKLWVWWYWETKWGILVHLRTHPSRRVCGAASLWLRVNTFLHLKLVRSNPNMGFPRKGIQAPNFNPIGYDDKVKEDSEESELGNWRSHIAGSSNMVAHGRLWSYLGNGLVSPTPHHPIHCRQIHLSITKPSKEGWFILGDPWDQNSKAQKHA